MGDSCFHHRLTDCLVRYESVASEFCLQNGTKLVDFPIGRNHSVGHSPVNSKLAKLAGGEEEPGGVA